ncbi:transcription factor bHLH143-like isoform X1 [Zingiber officinale]|uniref:transcription factor bHLH143-like isoform X1 n=1 Tax=Zingiber officinale TaxID=94328 RepID=UPI001C4CB067|nr:transcription factor bHLH143-like isoform X1 [Zingiber officinale]XP_042453481.1 transcription factor bHLH143-like isoform X1 [Zingiber officinale]XP_042453482.1 transcription factor bHLH143-like isoform X1 [Zingiber officinale]XP_042453483.1 transcription factor bHLH143-like isoform X1 [Zingiber officinale]
MEQENNPQINSQSTLWQFSSMISAGNNTQFVTRPQNSISMLSTACVDPSTSRFPLTYSIPFPGFYTDTYFPKTSPLIPALISSHRAPELFSSDKRYLVSDQLVDGRSFILSSVSVPTPCINSVNRGFNLQGNTETSVSNGHGADEMHEDTEEIDALLYSDSDFNNGDEETSTGHSPAEPEIVERTFSEVASSVPPTKRRRVDVDDEFDASLIDTASSQVLHCPDIPTEHRNKEDDNNTASSRFEVVGPDQNEENRQFKRAKIQETLGILRKIIPGGNCKDAVTVLDEAINYLKSLKLKVKLLESFP